MTTRLGTLPLPHIGLSMPQSADLVGGVTSGCVIVPCAVAYASLAGLPLQTGLYASLAGLLAYALLGTSPLLSVSITSTLGILTADALTRTIPSGDTTAYIQGATTLALLAGVILVIVGFLRLGFLADFISLPALTGFKIGLGLWIASSQLGKLLGIPFTSENFFKNIRQAIDGLDEISASTLGFTAFLFLCVFGVRFIPRKVPVALMLVLIGIAAEIVLDVESHGVALIGHVPSGLPSLAAPSTDYLGSLVPAAIGIAIMASFESIAIGRVVAPAGTRPKTNRDCVAIGGANLLASFFQGMPAAGGGTQTLVNADAGARSQVSQVIAAGVVVLGLTVLAPLFSYLPQASLGVVIIVAAAGMVAPKEILAIRAIRKRDFYLAVLAAVSVIFLGPLLGIFVSVAVSMLVLIWQANHPPVYELPDWSRPGLLAVRIEGGIYFANAEIVRGQLMDLVAQHNHPRVLLIEASSIREIEYSGLESLMEMARDLSAEGTDLWLAELNARPNTILRRRLRLKRVPSIALFGHIRQAVSFYEESTSLRAAA